MAIFKRKDKAKKSKAVSVKEASYDFINASHAFEQSRISKQPVRLITG